MYDSHCHLHGERMRPVLDGAIARAKAAGVTGFMLAGVEPDDWRSAVALHQQYPECAVSYGVHPQLVPEVEPAACRALVQELAAAAAGRDGWARPHAIGEIGLDRATEARVACMELQEEVFRAQLAVARELDLPVLLHVLRAHGPALEILQKDGVPRAGGVVHSYSGSAELVRSYVDLGLSISFAGYVTRANAKKVRAAVPAVPDDRLMVETDAPDQTPLPWAPAPNEPAYLTHVVEAVAALRGTTAADVAALSEANARRLYRV